MAKTLAEKQEVAVQAFDFDLEVVETKALWERWKGIALTWRSATVDLGRKLWTAHQALGGSDKPGPKKANVRTRTSNVRTRTSNVRTRTIGEFIEGVGMPRSTFYDFISRMKESMDAGIDLLTMPGDMKLIEAAAQKSQSEVELEKKVAQQEREIKNRESAVKQYKADIATEQEKLKKARKTIKELKAKADGQTKPDPELLKKISELEKRHETLEKEVDWYSTATKFKNEMTVLIDNMQIVETLGKRIISTKKPK